VLRRLYLWLAGGGKKAFDERAPFGVECETTKCSRALIPIFGIRGLAAFAVHVGVDRHAIRGFQFIHEGVGASPVTFCIPPKRGEWRGEAVGRLLACDRCFEFLAIHVRLQAISHSVS